MVDWYDYMDAKLEKHRKERIARLKKSECLHDQMTADELERGVSPGIRALSCPCAKCSPWSLNV